MFIQEHLFDKKNVYATVNEILFIYFFVLF